MTVDPAESAGRRPAARTDLRSRLRHETALEHQRLEDALDLLSPPPDEHRFRRSLTRFWGFHRVWEASLRRQPGLTAMMADRGKLGRLHADLLALGLSAAEIEALPLCEEAARLASSPARAAGSLYVIEGSTLGGQVIARALSAATWTPADGLSYFTPYGAEAGARWRAFLAWLEAQSSPATDPEIAAGAVETFQVLRRWVAVEAAA